MTALALDPQNSLRGERVCPQSILAGLSTSRLIKNLKFHSPPSNFTIKILLKTFNFQVFSLVLCKLTIYVSVWHYLNSAESQEQYPATRCCHWLQQNKQLLGSMEIPFYADFGKTLKWLKKHTNSSHVCRLQSSDFFHLEQFRQ